MRWPTRVSGICFLVQLQCASTFSSWPRCAPEAQLLGARTRTRAVAMEAAALTLAASSMLPATAGPPTLPSVVTCGLLTLALAEALPVFAVWQATREQRHALIADGGTCVPLDSAMSEFYCTQPSQEPDVECELVDNDSGLIPLPTKAVWLCSSLSNPARDMMAV